MRITSPAFSDGGEIPTEHTAEGADLSPALEWDGVPANAKSLALIVDDPDAPDPAKPQRTWVHWVLTDIPPSAHGLSGDRVPAGVHVGANDWKRLQWNGPSPPIGRHRYYFKLYALDKRLDLERPTKRDVERAMDGHVLAQAQLVGTYEKHRA